MKYTGRIILLMIVFIVSIVENIFFHYNYGSISLFEIVDIIFYLPIAWFFGLQFDKAKFFSEKDYLTETYNRRIAYEMFPKYKGITDRNKQKLGVFVIDVNDFKRMNDTYGHEYGDQALKNLSDTFTKNTRKEDMVIRWGGDEFVIIAPNTNNDGAKDFIKRIDSKIDKLSVSIGFAIYPDQAKTFDELLRIADKNMYEIKKNNLIKSN